MDNLGPMSEDERKPEEAGTGEFELPLPDEEEAAEGRRLRRRLFGYRAGDVEAAISSRDETLAVLRRDVAALWLAFGQHERAIRQMLDAIEALGGASVDPPGSRADGEGAVPATGVHGAPTPAAAAEGTTGTDAATDAGPVRIPAAPEAIGAQLAGLDDVLAAIEHATHSLEQAYAEEISGGTEPKKEADAAAEAEQRDDGGAENDDQD
jgi:hypothetical protein